MLALQPVVDIPKVSSLFRPILLTQIHCCLGPWWMSLLFIPHCPHVFLHDGDVSYFGSFVRCWSWPDVILGKLCDWFWPFCLGFLPWFCAYLVAPSAFCCLVMTLHTLGDCLQWWKLFPAPLMVLLVLVALVVCVVICWFALLSQPALFMFVLTLHFKSGWLQCQSCDVF